MAIFFKRLFATIFGFLLAVIIFMCGVAGLLYIFIMGSMPADRVINNGTVLEIDLSQEIIDSPRPLSLSQFVSLSQDQEQPTRLLSALKALDAAAEDPNIVAISLRMSGRSDLSLANGEELRDALQHFVSSSAKPIYAFGEGASQMEYYVASVAEHITLAPLGAVEWQGVAMNMMFYAPLLNHLGVKSEVFRPANCTYKAAVEPFTRGDMSPESREQSLRLVDSFWGGVVGQVSASRNISESLLRRLAADKIILGADIALESRLVDEIGYLDQYEARLEGVGAVRSESNRSDSKERRGSLRSISLGEYSRLWGGSDDLDGGVESGLLLSGSDKIAVVYVDGAIVDGSSDFASGTVGSRSFIQQLRRAANDDSVRAVVVRVNSPGGSALAADIMWREMELLRAKKPVVISMGSYAASGGYYISAPADIIVADRFTLTGSIGVYGVMFDIDEALRTRLYLHQQGVVSSPSADFGRLSRPITALERAAVMRGVEQVYSAFVGAVAQGRDLSPAIVMALSGGRVWSGVEAASCNLVDSQGGLRMALALAANRSGVSSDDLSVVEFTGYSDNQWLWLLSSLNSSLLGTLSVDLLGLFGCTSISDSSLMRDLRVISSSERSLVMFSSERVHF